MSPSAQREELLAEARPQELCLAARSILASDSASVRNDAHSDPSAKLGGKAAEDRTMELVHPYEIEGRSRPQVVVAVASPVQQRLSIAQHTTSVAKMKRLYDLLQRLGIEQRRAVLMRSFLQEQRIALERWILEHRSPRDVVPKQKTRIHSCQHEQGKGRQQERRRTLARPTMNHSRLNERGITVHHRKKYNFYSAMVFFERIEFRSREVPTLHVAVVHLKVLREAKEVLSARMQKLKLMPLGSDESTTQVFSETLQALLPSVFSEVCLNHGIDVDRDLGLYLRVNTPARRWIGTSLCGPVFHLRKKMQEGLDGWRLMQVASHCGWSSKEDVQPNAWEELRKTYLMIWTLAGRNPAKIRKMDEHLNSLYQRHSRLQEAKVGPIPANIIPPASTTKYVNMQKREIARAARSQELTQRIEAKIRIIVSQWTARFIKAVARVARVSVKASCRRDEKVCDTLQKRTRTCRNFADQHSRGH